MIFLNFLCNQQQLQQQQQQWRSQMNGEQKNPVKPENISKMYE